MSGLRISAYRQRHPRATNKDVAEALGISERTVYRHRIVLRTPLPTWEVSELGLKVWLGLGEVGTLSNLMHDLGCSRATLQRGLAELRRAGLLLSFRSPSTGKTIYRRLEEPVRDPFDILDDEPKTVGKKKKKKTGSVAETADAFADWVKQAWPSAPFQTNRRALMGALSRARKDNGVTAYQEMTALQTWIATGPRVKGHVPLWKQFLASYPSLLADIPTSEPVVAAPRPQADHVQKAAREAFEEIMEMARNLDREMKKDDYDEWFDRYLRKATYTQRVSSGASLSDPWEPPLSAPAEDAGTGGVVVDDGLDGQSYEGGGDPGGEDWSRFFEKEDTSIYYQDESYSHQDADV